LDHIVQVCDRALQNAKENFDLLRDRIFTRSHRAGESVLEDEQCDYLMAYKASIRNESLPCSSNAPRAKEAKRKVEILDESCVTRLRIDELVHWFEDFGKDGIIIQNAKDREALSDAA